MGLIQPSGPQWAYCTSSLTGTPAATNNGTTVTPGTSNANGTAVSLIAGITHDVEYLVIAVSGFMTAAAVNRTQLDFMIDPAGGTSWDTTNLLIPDLIVGGAPAYVTGAGVAATYYHFPLWINSGASIGVRARGSHTVAAANPRVIISAFGGNQNPASWWCGQKVEAIGTTAASSSGQSHSAGASGAYSAWTSLGSTTTYDSGAIQFGVQSQLSAHAARGYFFEFGRASTRIGFPIAVATTTSETCTYTTPTGPIFCKIPSGTQLQVRGTSSGTAEAMDVAAYIVS